MTKKQASDMLNSYGGAALQFIAFKRLQSKIKVILDEYELNMTQWLIISRLNEKQAGQRTTDLARFMNVEVPLVTMMTRPLRNRGLITSVIRKPDKREKLLCVTESAKDIVAAVETRLHKQLAGLVEDVSTQELQSYFKVLQTMAGSTA